MIFQGEVVMNSLIENKVETLKELCVKYHVKRLELFGSATDDKFDVSKSDMDFIVEFQSNVDMGPWLSHYFDFKDELERLFGCNVDLMMSSAPSMKNPYFLRELNRTRNLLYAA